MYKPIQPTSFASSEVIAEDENDQLKVISTLDRYYLHCNYNKFAKNNIFYLYL